MNDATLRLHLCQVARQVWHLLPDHRSRHAVEVAELFAAGEATADDLAAARTAAKAAQSLVAKPCIDARAEAIAQMAAIDAEYHGLARLWAEAARETDTGTDADMRSFIECYHAGLCRGVVDAAQNAAASAIAEARWSAGAAAIATCDANPSAPAMPSRGRIYHHASLALRDDAFVEVNARRAAWKAVRNNMSEYFIADWRAEIAADELADEWLVGAIVTRKDEMTAQLKRCWAAEYAETANA